MRRKAWAAGLAFILVLGSSAPAFSNGSGQGPDWAAVGAPSGPEPERTVRSPWTLADTRGDVPNGSGDIAAIKIEHRSSTVRLTVRTRLGSNPARSASWRSGRTAIIWAIDVNNGGGPDFLAGIFNDGAEVISEVVRNNRAYTHRCDATFRHNQPTQFQMEFPRSCISSHPAIRAFATMLYDRFPSRPSVPPTVDESPNTTWSPNVTR